MTHTRDRRRFEKYLLELTALPTAAGHEHRVIEWVLAWANRRKGVKIRRDRFGNILLSREQRSKNPGRPMIFAAHMDHPAFVLTRVEGQFAEAVFLGGVADQYFKGAKVRVRGGEDDGVRGTVEGFTPHVGGVMDARDKYVRIRFARHMTTNPGQIVTWDVGPAQIKRGRLHAPACDDLAAVAAAIAAFEKLLPAKNPRDVRLLLTRSEEVGFIGAMGACRSRLIPKTARIVALENSKELPTVTMGGGPIVRVGDRTSTFDPALTGQIACAADALVKKDKAFAYQRALMTGGTCEATAYQALGYQATCVCLALGNYHNQGTGKDGKPDRIKPEIISLADYHSLIRLLVALGKDAPAASDLPRRLNQLFESRRRLIES